MVNNNNETMAYDYVQAISEDIKEYITHDLGVTFADFRKENPTKDLMATTILNDWRCFVGATSKGVGSYFSDTNKAQEALAHNLQHLKKAYAESEEEWDWDWEKADVIVREYFYDRATFAVVDELFAEYGEQEDDSEQEEENTDTDTEETETETEQE